MASKEDWLLRPILHHLCSYESLLNSKISLFDIVKMNEALDVESENRRILQGD